MFLPQCPDRYETALDFEWTQRRVYGLKFHKGEQKTQDYTETIQTWTHPLHP